MHNLSILRSNIVLIILSILVLSGFTGMVSSEERSEGISKEVPSRSGEMGNWTKLPSGGWPSDIDTQRANVMYRETEKELVVFNHVSSGWTNYFDVWSYFEVNDTWIKWRTHGPGPSETHTSKAFTSNENNTVAYFYGGYRQSNNYWDKLNIFFYSNMTWIQIDAPGTLGGRYWSEMEYDVSTDSVWIFGGRDRSGNRYDDLHQYNLTDGWYRPSPSTTPGDRDQPLMTITPQGDRIFVSLGRYDKPWGQPAEYKNDLWTYYTSNNTWIEVKEELGIPTESGAFFHYRNDTDDLILSMGFTDDEDQSLDNTYIIEPSNGTVQEVYLTGGIPPKHIQARDLMMDRKTVVIFGDESGRKDIWSLDLSSLTSSSMPGNLPWEGGSAFTGYDPEDGGKLMTLKQIGGSYWQLVYYSLATSSWESLYVSSEGTPTYHSGMASCYEPASNSFYLYGGYYRYNVGGYNYHYNFFSEFWKLDCETGEWTQINENGPPGERGKASLIADPINNEIYLFGGQIHQGDTNSLWKYSISSNIWSNFNFMIEPQPRMETSVVFDQEEKGFFMFGGQRNGTSNAELDDLWFYHADTEAWEKLPDGGDKPGIQNWAGLSYDTDTEELLLFGDTDDDPDAMYLWREKWLEWVSETPGLKPGEWSGHGQAYSPQTGKHYAWAHDGTEVWEYEPILRTRAIRVKMLDTDGSDLIPSGGDYKVFPSAGTYRIFTEGVTDLAQGDLLGFDVNIFTDDEMINLTWMKGSGIQDRTGNETWFTLGTPQLTWPEQEEWGFEIPFDVEYEAPNGAEFDIFIKPVTENGRSEEGRRLNAFRVLSDLKVAGYKFSTPLQPELSNGDWLFGRTDLTVANFSVSFKDDTTVYPLEGDFSIVMDTSAGDSSSWTYVPGEEGSITVPINGQDRDLLKVWLNLTLQSGEVLQTNAFQFNLDLDPPTSVGWVEVRADSILDNKVGYDNDNSVFLTWGSVFESGSGLKGICYSMDLNLWPQESNITNEFPEIIIRDEGLHTFYVWAMDNTSRAGPFLEATVIEDTHFIRFESFSPDPTIQVNTTDPTFTFTVTITDGLSGVNLSTIQYQQSLPDRSLSDWRDMEVESDNLTSVTFSYTVDLVPGLKNVVGVRATDMAGNDIRESPKFGVYYEPDLANPRADMKGPDDGKTVGGKVKLEWEGGFIEPDHLTYEVHVEDPKGNVIVEDTSSTSFDFTPDYPGQYTWWIVSKADGMTNQTEKRTFTYEAPLFTVKAGETPVAVTGSEVGLKVNVTNPLYVTMNITFSFTDLKGFTLEGGSDLQLSPDETREVTIALGTTGKEAGTYTLKLNATDEYGRTVITDVNIKVNPAAEGVNNEEGDEGFPLWIIIVIAVLVLLVIIIIVFLVTRKKKEEEEVAEEEEEEKPISLDYDPTGVVANGGSGVDSAVQLAPGMHTSEEEQRLSGSNVIEISLPSAKEPLEGETMEGDMPSPEEE